MPPSRRRMATVAERGRPTPSGQALTPVGFFGSLRSLAVSPGCWMLTNIVRPSGVHGDAGDLAADRPGQEAAELAGRGVGGQHLVVAEPPRVALQRVEVDMSVWIHSTPRASNSRPSGAAEDVALDVAALGLGVARCRDRRRATKMSQWKRRGRRSRRSLRSSA